jgi:hypothetical protein
MLGRTTTTNSQFVTPLKVTISIQKISQSQMDERRKKGLCYKCDSKWHFGHKCQSPKLFLLDSEEITEELDLSSQSELEGQSLDLMEFSHSEAKQKISLHAIIANVHPKTMRIVGRVKIRI